MTPFSPANRPKNVTKIAVLRPNSIGDYIFTLPALEALRASFPGAEIVLLGRQWHADFLDGRPGPVDRVVVLPFRRYLFADPLSDPADAHVQAAFFRAMAAESFDIAFQLYGGGRFSNPFAKRLGARLTVGLKADDAEPLDLWVPYVYYHSEILRYLEVAGLIGAVPRSIEPRLALTEQDRREARAALPDDSRPVVVLHPGTTDTRRRWPAAHFAYVGDRLARAGATVVVTGDDGEKALGKEVAAAMREPVADLCGKISLRGLAGLLARSRLVVANDTGPLHLARALGTRTVGLYWIGNVINAGPITAARHRVHVAWRINCPICGADCIANNCAHTDSFIADIPPVEVAASALELLGRAD
jgi:ADP-heptose:LPS heptosyltransferase